MMNYLFKVFVIVTLLAFVQNLPMQDESNVNKIGINDKAAEASENNNAKIRVNVAKSAPVTEVVKKSSEHKHTPPPECHGERKEVDPAVAEEYKAKKHTRPGKVKPRLTVTTTLQTTASTTPRTTQSTSTKKATDSTASTKKPTKRHGIKFDAKGDSIWEDDSDESPESNVGKNAGKLDAEGNMIDVENQASGERDEESDGESEESDGIPLITIPLVDILNKYARMMGGKRASNSRYEYSYEDENELKIREIKDRILDEVDNEDDDGDEKGDEDL